MEYIEDFLTTEEEQRVIEAIRDAEIATSGEIRVHLENELKEDCLEHAKEVFHMLHMDETKYKNGVLFYVAVNEKKFAVIGDSGIDKVVPDDFWESVKNTVTHEFSKGQRASGLVLGILEAGQKLQQYFPFEEEKDNELINDISRGKKI